MDTYNFIICVVRGCLIFAHKEKIHIIVIILYILYVKVTKRGNSRSFALIYNKIICIGII